MNGLYLLKPSSISSTGSGNSSSIGVNGSVTFSSCDSLSINDVFSSDFTNYKLMIRHNGTASSPIYLKLRLNNEDSTTDYRYQSLLSYGTTTSGNRYSSSFIEIGSVGAGTTERAGTVCYLFGPNLADWTTTRSFDTGPLSAVYPSYITSHAGSHDSPVSYTGFTINVGAGLMTGLLSVYGLVK